MLHGPQYSTSRTLEPPPPPPSGAAFLLVAIAAIRFSLSFVSGASNSFSIVRTKVSIRRFSLDATHLKCVSWTARTEQDLVCKWDGLERRPRLQKPIKAKERLRSNMVLQLFPLAPSEFVRHTNLCSRTP
jgi:hypothetical protein